MTDSLPIAAPRKYSTSMSETDLQTIAQLVEYIAANPFAYESHVQLIKLLHQGLVSHVYTDSSVTGDPHTYELLEVSNLRSNSLLGIPKRLDILPLVL